MHAHRTTFSSCPTWVTHGAVLVAGIALGGSLSFFQSPPPVSPALVVQPTVGSASPSASPAAVTPPSSISAEATRISTLSSAQTLSALRSSNTASPLAQHLLIAHFAEQDPHTALSYLDTLSSAQRSSLRSTAFSAWAAKAPEAAAAHLTESIHGHGLIEQEDSEAIAALAQQWAQTAPQAALDWLTTLPSDARASALNQVITSWAQRDTHAAQAAVNQLSSAADRAAAMRPLASALARNGSPYSIAPWSLSLPLEEQASAAAGLLSSWSQTDPRAATRWVQQLHAGRTKDAAISALVQSRALRRDPSAAAQWAATIQDPTLRAELVNLTFSRWQLHDAAAAERWAATVK